MKLTSKRGAVLYALVAAFLAGVIFMVSTLVVNADTWVMNRANRHVYTNGQLTAAGVIYDRSGTALAQTKDGKRVYANSSTLRKATLHAVGDTQGIIATGVQTKYSAELTGYDLFNGVYQIEKYGRGNDLTLNLDGEACAKAYARLDGHKGTVGVYNYKTGEILCMVSAPSYDPQNKPKNMESDSDYEGVYMNRLLSGLYAPGSTFKLITSTCAIENMPDVFERTWRCTGSYKTKDGVVKCNGTHGKVNFKQALAKSCNSAFAQIAVELGNDKLTQTANQAGFNQSLSLGNMDTAKSRFDVSKANTADLGWASIGQYTVLANPMQMMQFVGAVAHGGTAAAPSLVQKISSQSGRTLKSDSAKMSGQLLPANAADLLKDMMRNNVKSQYGSGNFPGLAIGAKSGTAQVDGKKDTAWFVGFLEDEAHPYAFVVVVEEGGAGSSVAGPIANAVLQVLVKK